MHTDPAEQWRPVAGYEGYYEVSDGGRVRSLDRVVVSRTGSRQCARGQLLKLLVDREGYCYIRLSREGTQKRASVHRLVMESFVGPCPDGLEVCHGDGDPTNNQRVNLRYDTRRNNNLDAVRHGTHTKRQRTHCPRRHPLAGRNLHPGDLRRGRRKCLACDRAHVSLRDLNVNGVDVDFQELSDRYYDAIVNPCAAKAPWTGKVLRACALVADHPDNHRDQYGKRWQS